MNREPREIDRLSLAELQMLKATWNETHRDPNAIEAPTADDYYRMMADG